MDIDTDSERFIRAFTDCITEHGALQMSADHLARRLGASRSGLYRQFGSWPQMIIFGYEAMLELIDVQLELQASDRRVEHETWWARVVTLLASPLGRGILAMRALAAVHRGEHDLEDFELTQLRNFKRWCSAPPAATRACWALVRVAGNPKLTADQRLQLREVAWLVVGGGGPGADVSDEAALAALF